MSEVNNIDVTALAEQVAEGTAEIVEAKSIKRGLSTGSKIGDAAVLVGTAGAAAALGLMFGIKHERKKWESYEDDCDDEDENFEEYEEFDEEEPDTDDSEKVDTQKEEK